MAQIGDLVDNLFSRGIDAWKDVEVAKNYAANDPRPATRSADGRSIPQGTDGVGGLANVVAANPIATSLVIAVIGGLIVWLIAKRL